MNFQREDYPAAMADNQTRYQNMAYDPNAMNALAAQQYQGMNPAMNMGVLGATGMVGAAGQVGDLTTQYDMYGRKRPATSTHPFDGSEMVKRQRMTQKNPPSRVVMIKDLGPNVDNYSIVRAALAFGELRYLIMLPKKGEAMLEFQDQASATMMVETADTRLLVIGANPVSVWYCKYQDLSPRHESREAHFDPQGTETVLLLSILNPLHPITPDVLFQALSKYGRILRVIVFLRSGLQAYVEFESHEAAAKTKANADGKNIYTGCCTLAINWTRLEKLQVKYNNNKSRDFTNNMLPSGDNAMNKGAIFPGAPGGSSGLGMGPGMQGGMMGMMGMPMADRPVCLVQPVPEYFTPDHIFNLFSVFGAVLRVKRLFNRPESVLVQFATGQMAQVAAHCMNGIAIDGKDLQVSISKHSQVQLPGGKQPDEASTLTKDFSESRLNRARQRHPFAPGHVVHFYNTPEGTTEDSLRAVLQASGAPAPVAVEVMPIKDSDPKPAKRLGRIHFQSVSDATKAIALCNNVELASNMHLKMHYDKNQNARPRN
eukprot:Rmarinus@m.16970